MFPFSPDFSSALYEEEEAESLVDSNSSSPQVPGLSENLRMFQSIHVLQSRDEDGDGLARLRAQDETQRGEDGKKPCTAMEAEMIFLFSVSLLDDEDSVCLSSVIFASAIGEETIRINKGSIV